MSRAKKGAASAGQVPVQKEAAVSPFSIEQMLKEIQDSIKGLEERMDEGQKKLSDRIEALEPNQRSPVRNMGPQEKSGERDNHATEVGGQEITPPE